MPLRASVNGEDVISVNLSDEEWKALRNEFKRGTTTIILPCCNQPGFLRTSSKGLNHFVHSRDSLHCNWEPESPQHLRAKVAIINACSSSGWLAIPEYSEADWRADVMAIKDSTRIAFEVQWSKQTAEETEFRQERYAKSGVKSCWLFRKPPKNLDHGNEPIARKNLPMFRIYESDNGEIMASVGSNVFTLGHLIDSIFNGRIKFCESYKTAPQQEIEFVFYEKDCWKCKQSQHGFYLNNYLSTLCNSTIYIASGNWGGEGIYNNPQILKTVLEILKSEEGIHLKVGQIKPRYSKTMHLAYNSQGCHYCGALFGDNFLVTERMHAQYNSNNLTITKTVNLNAIEEEGEHWCYSENKMFCS